jgi:glycine/D-amino acid oxidase-like deaminating enzyme
MQSDPPSYWLRSTSCEESLSESAKLEGTLKVDVCIVGGGLTGLWTAIKLKERETSLEVALVEQGRCGSGYSGRNEGLLSSWWDKWMELEALLGEEDGLRLARATDHGISAITSFCAREKIDIQLRCGGNLRITRDEQHRDRWRGMLDFLARAGENPFTEWSSDTVTARTGSPNYGIGIYEPNASSLHPGALVKGLHCVAKAKGVQVFEKTPMTDIGFGIPAVVETPRGRVVAERIVMATGAWSARFPEIRQALSVVSKHVMVTEADPALTEEAGLKSGLVISDNSPLAETYRATIDGRIVFGKRGMAGKPCFRGNVTKLLRSSSPDQSLFDDSLDRKLPRFSGLGPKMVWCAPVDHTVSGLPLFWHLGPNKNIYYGAGFSENLIGPSYWGGEILSSLALESVDEWSQSLLVRPPDRDFPNEPWRYIRSQIKHRALRRAERLANR